MSIVRRNIVWLLLAQGATWLMSILALVLVPGELGDAVFGDVSFALVYVSLFALVANFGTADFLTKTLARNSSLVGHYVFNVLLMKVVVSVGLSAVALTLAYAIGFDRQRLVFVGLFCVGMIAQVLNSVLVGGLYGMQKMARPALYSAISLYLGTAVGLVLLFKGGSVVGYVFALNATQWIPVVGNTLGLRAQFRSHRGIDLRVWKLVVTGGFPFFVMSGLLVIYGSVDIPMIEAFSGTEAVGWYSLAYKWISMPAFLAAAIATALFPALSAEGVGLTDSFTRMANRAINVILIVSIPASVGIALIASDFIHLLYGADFAQAVPLMRLLALHIPIVGLDIVLGTVAVAADRQREWVRFSMLAAILNPMANLLAIPLADDWFGNGAIGAAFATVLTELILMMGGLRIRPPGVLDRPLRMSIAKMVAASGAIIPTVLLLQSTPLLLQVVAGALVYAIASLLLGTVSVHDLRNLRGGLAKAHDLDANVVGTST